MFYYLKVISISVVFNFYCHSINAQIHGECLRRVPQIRENVEFTPFTPSTLWSSSLLECDENSRYDYIYFLSRNKPVSTSCNGINALSRYVTKGNTVNYPSYTGVINRGGIFFTEPIPLTNYTFIDQTSLGNAHWFDCGDVESGPCAGDLYSSFIFYEADQKEGCARTGWSSSTAKYYEWKIRGRCNVTCTLGKSLYGHIPAHYNDETRIQSSNLK